MSAPFIQPQHRRYWDRKAWRPGAFITDAGTIISDPRTGQFRLAAEATTAALHKLMRGRVL